MSGNGKRKALITAAGVASLGFLAAGFEAVFSKQKQNRRKQRRLLDRVWDIIWPPTR